MAIDTLAYAKALEAAGLDRQTAEAQAEAIVRHVLPDLATRSDLEQAVGRFEHRLDAAVERLEHRLDLTVERNAHQQTMRFFGMMLGVVGVMDAILFALLRVVH
jgi:hypothetical protein